MTERSPATAWRFTPAAVEGVDRRTVHLRTPDGVSLAGTLRVPQDAPTRASRAGLPTGPVAVSDQSVVAGYADRLTAAGYVTLALDPRNLGYSGGSPRQRFDMADRLRDLQAAISYLSVLADLVDPARIGALGASAGATVALVSSTASSKASASRSWQSRSVSYRPSTRDSTRRSTTKDPPHGARRLTTAPSAPG